MPGTLTRRQIRVCPSCDFVLPEDLIERRVKRGATTIQCPACEESILSLGEEPTARPEAALAEMNRSADDQRDRNVAEARLRGKIETRDYDVFLCYNSQDRERVKAVGEQLKDSGILPWLDVWEIRPGTRWQQELQKQIKSIKSAAVFIGPKGRGPWQDVEVESLLTQLVKRKCPIIPVILEGRPGPAPASPVPQPCCTSSTCVSRTPIRSGSWSGESRARSPPPSSRTPRVACLGGSGQPKEAHVSEQNLDEPDEFAGQFAERFHRNRREHGGEIDRLDEDQLAGLTEEERVAAGVDDYDPDEVPPATDTPPLTQDVRQTGQYQEERAEVHPGVRERRAPSHRRRPPVPAHPVRRLSGGGPL